MPDNYNAASTSAMSSGFQSLVDALGDPTRREIYLYALRMGSITASEIAAEFLVHPNVARHHLERLLVAGYLERVASQEGSPTVGRPSKRYRPTDAPELLTGSQPQSDLLARLLARLITELPEATVERIAYEEGYAYGGSLAKGLGSDNPRRSVSAAMQLLADALTRAGFSSHHQHKTQNLSLINRSCPFGVLAMDHPVLCATERGLIEGLLSQVLTKENHVMATPHQGSSISGCQVTLSSSPQRAS